MNDRAVGRVQTHWRGRIEWRGWKVGSINFLIDGKVIHKLSTFSLETGYIGWLR